MRCLLLTSMQWLLQSFSSKVLNCRLSVDLLPSLESNEGKPESRPSKVGLSDCLMGYICLPLLIWKIIIPRHQLYSRIALWDNFIYVIMIVWISSCSTFSILFIAFDRYIPITKPQRYHDILSKRRVNFIIVLFWVLDLPFSVGSVEIMFFLITMPPYLNGTTVFLCACYYFIMEDCPRKSEAYWKFLEQRKAR